MLINNSKFVKGFDIYICVRGWVGTGVTSTASGSNNTLFVPRVIFSTAHSSIGRAGKGGWVVSKNCTNEKERSATCVGGRQEPSRGGIEFRSVSGVANLSSHCHSLHLNYPTALLESLAAAAAHHARIIFSLPSVHVNPLVFNLLSRKAAAVL